MALTVTIEETKGYPRSVAIDTRIRLHYIAKYVDMLPASGCTLANPKWTWSGAKTMGVTVDGTKATIGHDYRLIVTSASLNTPDLMASVYFTPLKPGHWKLAAQASVTTTNSCGGDKKGAGTDKEPVSLRVRFDEDKGPKKDKKSPEELYNEIRKSLTDQKVLENMGIRAPSAALLAENIPTFEKIKGKPEDRLFALTTYSNALLFYKSYEDLFPLLPGST